MCTVQFGAFKVKQELKNCLGLGPHCCPTSCCGIDLSVSLCHLSQSFPRYFQYTFPSLWNLFYCFYCFSCNSPSKPWFSLQRPHENTFVAPQHIYLTTCPFHSFPLPNLCWFPLFIIYPFYTWYLKENKFTQSQECFCEQMQGVLAFSPTFSPSFSFPTLEAISHFQITFTNEWVTGFKDN